MKLYTKHSSWLSRCGFFFLFFFAGSKRDDDLTIKMFFFLNKWKKLAFSLLNYVETCCPSPPSVLLPVFSVLPLPRFLFACVNVFKPQSRCVCTLSNADEKPSYRMKPSIKKIKKGFGVLRVFIIIFLYLITNQSYIHTPLDSTCKSDHFLWKVYVNECKYTIWGSAIHSHEGTYRFKTDFLGSTNKMRRLRTCVESWTS